MQSNFRPKTDEHGLALWDGAPDIELTCDVSAPDHMRVNDVKLRPDGTEHLILLPNSVKVSGTVREEQSGELLGRFRIVCGWPHYNPLVSNTVSCPPVKVV